MAGWIRSTAKKMTGIILRYIDNPSISAERKYLEDRKKYTLTTVRNNDIGSSCPHTLEMRIPKGRYNMTRKPIRADFTFPDSKRIFAMNTATPISAKIIGCFSRK